MSIQKPVHTILCLILVISLLAACTPATPTAQPAAPTQPAEATKAPEPATQAPEPTAAPAATQPAAAPSTPSRLVMADSSGYYTLDPIVSASIYVAHYAVFDPLWTLNLDYTSYVGMLAEKWEPSADNLSIKITLKPGNKFTDGTPVDAAAIKWNIDTYRDPAVNSPFGAWMADVVKDTKVIDNLTLMVYLKEPYAPFYYWTAQMSFISPTAYQSLGPDKFGVSPVGSGPFIVKQVVPDSSILYTKNPDYKNYPAFLENRGPSHVDELLLKYGLDDQSTYAQLETGEVDLAVVPATMVSKARENPNLELFKNIQAGVRYLGFNTEVAPFNDVKFRQAIAYGLNRDELIKVGYEGEAIPMWGPLSPSVYGYDETVEAKTRAKEAFDPEKAKQLLSEAGYKDVNNDGIVEDKAGKPLALKLAFTTGTTAKLVCETLQAQLADIGLNVAIEPLEGQAIMDQTKEGTHQMIYWQYGLSEATILTYMFKSNRIGGSNRTRFNSPEMDKLLDSMESEMDPAARKAKIVAALEYVIDQRPMIPLLAEYQYSAFRKDKFTGIKFDTAGVPILGDAMPVK